MQGRATLMITHRLVGLEHMDEIIVIEQGCIRQRGTHANCWPKRLISHNGCIAGRFAGICMTNELCRSNSALSNFIAPFLISPQQTA